MDSSCGTACTSFFSGYAIQAERNVYGKGELDQLFADICGIHSLYTCKCVYHKGFIKSERGFRCKLDNKIAVCRNYGRNGVQRAAAQCDNTR